MNMSGTQGTSASSRNGLVQTKDRHQEPSLNYVFVASPELGHVASWQEAWSNFSRGSNGAVAAEGVRWPRFVACWYHRRSKGSRSGGTTTPSQKEGNISIRSRHRGSPRV